MIIGFLSGGVIGLVAGIFICVPIMLTFAFKWKIQR